MTLTKPDLSKPCFKLFPMAVVDIAAGLCPVCRARISEKEFRDEQSRQEYAVSGMCQKCQDSVFGGM